MRQATVNAPRFITMDERDNVAIVANDGGLPAGTVFPSGLTLLEKVPQAHKVALVDIPEGGAVRRYNVTEVRDGIAQLTARAGTPYGLAEVPVIKVATRSDLARRWHDLMDVNAGTGDLSRRQCIPRPSSISFPGPH